VFASGFLEALPSASASAGSSQLDNAGSDDDDTDDEDEMGVTVAAEVTETAEVAEAVCRLTLSSASVSLMRFLQEEPVMANNETDVSPAVETKDDQSKKKVDVTSPTVLAHRSYKIVKLTDTP
jgi:hypothetical protein